VGRRLNPGADPALSDDAAIGTVRVWDPAVRVLHWTLVVGVALGWATTEWFGDWHKPVGYAALAVVVVRIAWGLIGPPHARFASFVRSPAVTVRYARLALSGHAPRYVGHNPLGGVMVIALFSCIGALALTGWLYTTDRFWGDETVESIHGALAWTLVVLIALHVIGVIFASAHQRENLIGAMLHGRKRAPRDGDIA